MNWLDARNRRCFYLQLLSLAMLMLWAIGFCMAWRDSVSPLLGVFVVLIVVVCPFLGLLLSLISMFLGDAWLKASGFLTFLICAPFAAFVLNAAKALPIGDFWRYWPF